MSLHQDKNKELFRPKGGEAMRGENAQLLHDFADLQVKQAHLTSVVDSVPAMIGYWGSDLRNQFANSAYLEWFGYTPEELRGLHIRDMLGEALFEGSRSHIEAVLAGEVQLFDRTLLTPGGRERHSQVSYIPDKRGNEVVGFFALVTDITPRKVTELALAETEARMRVTLSSIGDAVISTDQNGVVSFLNPVAEEMTGWLLSEAIGRPIEDVMDLRHSETRLKAVNPLRIALRDRIRVGMADDCVLIQCRNGGVHGVEDCAAPIRDADENIVGAVIVFRDVGQARAMAMKMSHMDQHDALTDLPNRLLLHDRLHLATIQAKRNGERFALMFLDLDHFKDINDSLGHSVGDELLRAVARRISMAVRAGDTVSRQGGDEFIILMPEIESAEHAASIAQRLLEAVRPAYVVTMAGDTVSISVTVSVGIAMFPDDGDSPETLLRRADAAMYVSKRSGRNRIHFFSPELEESLSVRQAHLADMRASLSPAYRNGMTDAGEFTLVYQPIVDAKTRKIVGAEALARWRSPSGEQVPPGRFIPIAEECGMMVPIGEHVLRLACRQARVWREKGLENFRLSVNISPVQLADSGFLGSLKGACYESAIDPTMLQIEITETALIHSADVATTVLYGVRDFGVAISLDDFGTGFSSLGHLQAFPVNEIKIDRAFVSGRKANPADQAIVAAICGLGETLGITVVAEGVETEEQADRLARLPCDELQGFLFSVPVKEAEFERLFGQALLI